MLKVIVETTQTLLYDIDHRLHVGIAAQAAGMVNGKVTLQCRLEGQAVFRVGISQNAPVV